MGFQTTYTTIALRTVSEAGMVAQFFLHATSGKSLIVPAEIPASSYGVTTTEVVRFDKPVTKPEAAKLMMAMPEFRGKDVKGFLKQFTVDHGAVEEAKPAKAAPAPAPVAVAQPVKAPKAVAKAAAAVVKAAKAPKAPKAPKAVKAPKAPKVAAKAPEADTKTPEQSAVEIASLNKIKSLLQNKMNELPVPAAATEAA